MSCRSPTWEKLTAACRAEQEKMIMVTNWDTSALVWKDWGKPEGREETQDSCQTSSQLIFCFLPVCWQTVIHLSVSLTDKHTWVVCEAVCIDVGDPVLQLRVLLHLSVSTVIHIQPADHKPAAHTHEHTAHLLRCVRQKSRNNGVYFFIPKNTDVKLTRKRKMWCWYKISSSTEESVTLITTLFYKTDPVGKFYPKKGSLIIFLSLYLPLSILLRQTCVFLNYIGSAAGKKLHWCRNSAAGLITWRRCVCYLCSASQTLSASWA